MTLSLDTPDVTDFIAFLRLKNVSAQTLAQYQWVLKDLLRFCSSIAPTMQEITSAQLREYLSGLQAKKLAPKTIADRVLIFKRFFGYLAGEGRIASDPAMRLPVPKTGRRLPKALTLEEMRTFFDVVQGQSAIGRRDKVLFELLYACGLRISEAVSLRVEDLNFSDNSLRVVGKGDCERRIYCKPSLMASLQDYIRATASADLLFPGYKGQPLNRRTVEHRIREYAKSAGITRRVTPHVLRHSIAVHSLQGGAPVSFVQGLLGHASLATTGKYLQLTDQMAQEIALRTPNALDRAPASKKKGRLRESPTEYVIRSERDSWDAYVWDVLLWMS